MEGKEVLPFDHFPRATYLAAWLLKEYGRDEKKNRQEITRFLVSIWRISKPGSLISARIEEACLGLVELAAITKEPEAWIPPFLFLIKTIQPPACLPPLLKKTWEMLPELNDQPTVLRHSWLAAMASYLEQPTELHPIWQSLLSNPNYREIAYRALGHELHLAVRYLPEYYASARDRAAAAKSLIRALRQMYRNTFPPYLHLLFRERYWPLYEGHPLLCQRIDETVKGFGYPPIFFVPSPVLIWLKPSAGEKEGIIPFPVQANL
jgi:hypothetical protein